MTTTPLTKTARHAQIAVILDREQVRSQEELAELLERHAHVHVTQATLSRDLDELGVVRLRAAGGGLVYAMPGQHGGLAPHPDGTAGRAEHEASRNGDEGGHSARLGRYLVELLTAAEGSANLTVLRTQAGAAQFLASIIDHEALPSVIGTVAGDDTVLIITRDPAGGSALAADFLRWAERRRLSPQDHTILRHSDCGPDDALPGSSPDRLPPGPGTARPRGGAAVLALGSGWSGKVGAERTVYERSAVPTCPRPPLRRLQFCSIRQPR